MAEQQPITQSPGEAERRQVVFAPRIDSTLREQVEGLRSITGQTINEVGEEALQGWIASKLDDENLRTQAMAGIEEEERRLQERREALSKVLGGTVSNSGEERPESGNTTNRSGRRARATE